MCACASTSARCVSSTKSRAVFCPSHQFLLREHESSEEIATRFDTQHANIQHTTVQCTEESACVRSACDEAPMSSVSSFLPAHAAHPSANLAQHEVLPTGCYVCSALSSYRHKHTRFVVLEPYCQSEGSCPYHALPHSMLQHK